VVTDAPLGLVRDLDLGDQRADRGLPARELDARGLADDAAAAVAADEVLGAQRLAAGDPDVDAGFVLRGARHLPAALDRDRQLADPLRQQVLEADLRQREAVVVTGGKVAEVEPCACEALDLHRPALREKPVGDTALVEHLDRACMQTAGARADEVLARSTLDDRDVDPGEGELAREHQARRTASRDHDGMRVHRHVGRNTGRAATRRPVRNVYSAGSSEPCGSSGGTVTFSGVTSPGMNVMSTSSPGSPSSRCLRPTRIVEPGSIARPST